MARITLYATRFCPYCMMARRLLSSKGVSVDEVPVDGDPALRRKMTERAGGCSTVPQIFVDDRHIGGYDEMADLDRRGQLDPLLGKD